MWTVPFWVYFYCTALCVEAASICILLAQPIWALNRYGAGPAQLGALGLIAGGSYAVLAWGVSRRSAQWPVRASLGLGLGGPAVCAVLQPFCGSFGWFLILVGMQWGLLAFYWPLFMKILGEQTPTAVLARTLSRFNVGWACGGILGAGLSGMLYDRFGPAAPFWAGAGILGVVLAVIALGRIPSVEGKGVAVEFAPASRRPAGFFLHRAWLVMGLCFFVMGMLVHLFPYLAQNPPYAMTSEAISRLHVLRQGAMLATFLVMGLSMHWHFRRYPIHICLGLIALMLLAMATGRSPRWFGLAFGLIGVASGVAFGLSAYYSLYLTEGRGERAGMHEALLASSSALGPWIGGHVQAWSQAPRLPYWLGLGLVLAIWGWKLASDWQGTRRAAVPPPGE